MKEIFRITPMVSWSRMDVSEHPILKRGRWKTARTAWWPALSSTSPDLGLAPARAFSAECSVWRAFQGYHPHRKEFVKNRYDSKRHCLLTSGPLSRAFAEGL